MAEKLIQLGKAYVCHCDGKNLDQNKPKIYSLPLTLNNNDQTMLSRNSEVVRTTEDHDLDATMPNRAWSRTLKSLGA